MSDEIAKKELTIERIFNAPIELVWKTWTEPELMKKWWGPKYWTAPIINTDFKVGGKYLLCMRGAMGPGQPEVDSWSAGVYKEIIPMSKIVVLDYFSDKDGNKIHASAYGLPESFPMESIVEISFESLGENQTKLTVHYPDITGIEGKMLENMNMGWNQSLDKFAAALI